jgi:hypothetical protein
VNFLCVRIFVQTPAFQDWHHQQTSGTDVSLGNILMPEHHLPNGQLVACGFGFAVAQRELNCLIEFRIFAYRFP